MVYYLKSLRTGRIPPYQGGMPLPVGEWLPTIANPVLCERGWHALRWEDVPSHLFDELWVVELAGEIAESGDKVAAESMRLVRQVETWSDKAYREALTPADKAYGEALAPVREAYREALTPADKAYGEALTTAREAYREALATADKAYDEAVATALGELTGLNPAEFAHRGAS